MSKITSYIDLAKSRASNFNEYIGNQLLKLPILSEEFKKFKSNELSLDNKNNLNALINSLEDYLSYGIDSKYNFFEISFANDFLVNLKSGMQNSLLVENQDSDILNEVLKTKNTIDLLISFVKLKNFYVQNLPEALRKYGSEIGKVLVEKRAEITDLLTTGDKRASAFSDAISNLLLKCMGIEDSLQNKLFLIEVINNEDYKESLWNLTMDSIDDADYKTKLRGMWFKNAYFVDNSEHARYQIAGNPIVEWNSIIPLANDVAYRISIRKQAADSLDNIQLFRNENSGPLYWQGYLVLSPIFLALYFLIFGKFSDAFVSLIIMLVAWYFMRDHIVKKRNKFTCHNCGEIFTIAVAKSDYVGSQQYTVQVATQSQVKNNEGKNIATIHGQKEEVRVAHTYNEHRCCLSCGVVFQENVVK